MPTRAMEVTAGSFRDKAPFLFRRSSYKNAFPSLGEAFFCEQEIRVYAEYKQSTVGAIGLHYWCLFRLQVHRSLMMNVSRRFW